MAFNGSGTFNRTNGVNSGSGTWAADLAAGSLITAARHDTHDQDIADGLSNCITKDGQTTITANIPFNSKELTNVAAMRSTSGTDISIYAQGSAGIELHTNGNNSWGLKSTGHLEANSDRAYNIGSATNRIDKIYAEEILGAQTEGSDSIIYTETNSTVIDTSTSGVIALRTAGTSRVLITANEFQFQNSCDIQMQDGEVFFSDGEIAAAGTVQGDATAITQQVTKVTGADGTKGVVLPTSTAGAVYRIHNSDASSALKLYPQSGGSVNGGTTNVHVTLAAKETAHLMKISSTEWIGGVTVDF